MTPTNPQQEAQTSEVSQILRKALAAFGPNGEHWTQGYRAKPEGPGPFEYPFCCVGTSFNRIEGIGNKGKDAGLNALAKAARLQHIPDLPVWNDAPERTFADVKALFEKAIAKAEKQP